VNPGLNQGLNNQGLKIRIAAPPKPMAARTGPQPHSATLPEP